MALERAPSWRCCTYGVDVAEREVVDVEFLGDVKRRVNNDGRFMREPWAMQDVSETDQRYVLV